MAFGILYANQEMLLFPAAFFDQGKICGRHLDRVAISPSSTRHKVDVANFAHLGGLFFGFLFVKFMPRAG